MYGWKKTTYKMTMIWFQTQVNYKMQNQVTLQACLPKGISQSWEMQSWACQRLTSQLAPFALWAESQLCFGSREEEFRWQPTARLMVAYMKNSPPGTGIRKCTEVWPCLLNHYKWKQFIIPTILDKTNSKNDTIYA